MRKWRGEDQDDFSELEEIFREVIVLDDDEGLDENGESTTSTPSPDTAEDTNGVEDRRNGTPRAHPEQRSPSIEILTVRPVPNTHKGDDLLGRSLPRRCLRRIQCQGLGPAQPGQEVYPTIENESDTNPSANGQRRAAGRKRKSLSGSRNSSQERHSPPQKFTLVENPGTIVRTNTNISALGPQVYSRLEPLRYDSKNALSKNNLGHESGYGGHPVYYHGLQSADAHRDNDENRTSAHASEESFAPSGLAFNRSVPFHPAPGLAQQPVYEFPLWERGWQSATPSGSQQFLRNGPYPSNHPCHGSFWGYDSRPQVFPETNPQYLRHRYNRPSG